MSIRSPYALTKKPLQDKPVSALDAALGFAQIAILRQQLEDLIQTHKEEFDKAIAEKKAEADRVIANVKKITKGDKGDMPVPGIHFPIPQDAPVVDEQAMEERVLSRIRQPEDGTTPIINEAAIAQKVLKLVKIPLPIAPKVEPIDHTKIAEVVIETLIKDKKLKPEHIAGLPNELASYRNQLAGKHYGSDTMVRGGGDTVAAGSNVTITTVNGVKTISANASGGSGFQVPLSGVVDGSNKIFVWASAPNSISVDQGRGMQKTSSDGTGNWTGTTTTTLSVAPTFDVFSLG